MSQKSSSTQKPLTCSALMDGDELSYVVWPTNTTAKCGGISCIVLQWAPLNSASKYVEEFGPTKQGLNYQQLRFNTGCQW